MSREITGSSNPDDKKGDIVGWLRRRQEWPIVSVPGELAGEIADHIEGLQHRTPYGWMIEGSHQVWLGDFAEDDAKAEARRTGGACVAFPIFK